ncbi:MAG: hypothetical protein MJK14_10455 [Rivularia sp. ALOHA_DT_140]|nr:hypothetical protein [Rivularia sp. ALOHA_DT_140]
MIIIFLILLIFIIFNTQNIAYGLSSLNSPQGAALVAQYGKNAIVSTGGLSSISAKYAGQTLATNSYLKGTNLVIATGAGLVFGGFNSSSKTQLENLAYQKYNQANPSSSFDPSNPEGHIFSTSGTLTWLRKSSSYPEGFRVVFQINTPGHPYTSAQLGEILGGSWPVNGQRRITLTNTSGQVDYDYGIDGTFAFTPSSPSQSSPQNFAELSPSQKQDAISLLSDQDYLDNAVFSPPLVVPTSSPTIPLEINNPDNEPLKFGYPLSDGNFRELSLQSGTNFVPNPAYSSATTTDPSTDPNTETTIDNETPVLPNTQPIQAEDFGNSKNWLQHGIDVFSSKFPFDIFGDFTPDNNIVTECPSYTFFDYPFELCPVKTFFSIMKIPVIIGFLIWSFMQI